MAPKKKPVKRRAPGTGSIRYKKGRALPFEAAFKHSDGTTQYDAFGSAEEAAAHLDGLVKERDSEAQPINTAKGAQTFTQFTTAWLQIKAGRVSEKTLQDYKYQCDVAAGEGGLGNVRIRDIDLMMADTMLSSLGRKGYKNVAQMRMVLRQAFEYAFDNDYIKKNPFQKAKPPRVKHRKAIALTEPQRDLLLEFARIETGMPLLPLWHLESRLAFRRGEALGLRWIDIDWEHKTITIRQQRTTVGNQTVTRDTPKGDEKKIRTVPVYDDILELLKAHRLEQRKRELADLDWENKQGFVFVGDHGKPPAANRVNKRLAEIIERANASNPAVSLPTDLHPHDLRHTALFLLEQAGVPPSIRMALGGHSTAAMALHYIDHASVEDVRRALGA